MWNIVVYYYGSMTFSLYSSGWLSFYLTAPQRRLCSVWRGWNKRLSTWFKPLTDWNHEVWQKMKQKHINPFILTPVEPGLLEWWCYDSWLHKCNAALVIKGDRETFTWFNFKFLHIVKWHSKFCSSVSTWFKMIVIGSRSAGAHRALKDICIRLSPF